MGNLTDNLIDLLYSWYDSCRSHKNWNRKPYLPHSIMLRGEDIKPDGIIIDIDEGDIIPDKLKKYYTISVNERKSLTDIVTKEFLTILPRTELLFIPHLEKGTHVLILPLQESSERIIRRWSGSKRFQLRPNTYGIHCMYTWSPGEKWLVEGHLIVKEVLPDMFYFSPIRKTAELYGEFCWTNKYSHSILFDKFERERIDKICEKF